MFASSCSTPKPRLKRKKSRSGKKSVPFCIWNALLKTSCPELVEKDRVDVLVIIHYLRVVVVGESMIRPLLSLVLEGFVREDRKNGGGDRASLVWGKVWEMGNPIYSPPIDKKIIFDLFEKTRHVRRLWRKRRRNPHRLTLGEASAGSRETHERAEVM